MATATRIDPETLPVRSDLKPTNWKVDVRDRRSPRFWQWDYLFLRTLVGALADALPEMADRGGRVLDVYCGSRPFEDLLPDDTRVIGLDITPKWGMADVVSDEFLPFTDASFDAAMCIDAIGYTPDPERAAAELARVLAPGGRLVITFDFTYEFELHRFTAAELEQLFAGWDEVEVAGQGGRGVAWARLTNSIFESVLRKFGGRSRLLRPIEWLGVFVYVPVNALGALLELVERRWRVAGAPANLTLTARRPSG
jgi:SAM-dependent methyltransferase